MFLLLPSSTICFSWSWSFMFPSVCTCNFISLSCSFHFESWTWQLLTWLYCYTICYDFFVIVLSWFVTRTPEYYIKKCGLYPTPHRTLYNHCYHVCPMLVVFWRGHSRSLRRIVIVCYSQVLSSWKAWRHTVGGWIFHGLVTISSPVASCVARVLWQPGRSLEIKGLPSPPADDHNLVVSTRKNLESNTCHPVPSFHQVSLTATRAPDVPQCSFKFLKVQPVSDVESVETKVNF